MSRDGVEQAKMDLQFLKENSYKEELSETLLSKSDLYSTQGCSRQPTELDKYLILLIQTFYQHISKITLHL